MIREDIKPGYAPKEISFRGYTTKNLHHSADAARAFQDTIDRVGKQYPADVLSALKHTDDYMKLNDLHLEQGKAPDESELKAWRYAHTEARNMLNKVGEFMHHEDYWHMHEHEIQDLETNFTPAAVGAEMAESHTPQNDLAEAIDLVSLRKQIDKHTELAVKANKAGDDEAVKKHQGHINAIKDKMAKLVRSEEVVVEELTDKTIKSGDKVKVARVIADMLGVDNAETMSPDVAVNAGLRKVKNKRMTPELVGVVKKMLALASEVGIKVDQSLVPKAVSEETITELKRDTLKSYIAKSMGSKSSADFMRGVKMAQGSGGEEELRAKSEKRSAGIHTAIKKLSKEELEEGQDYSVTVTHYADGKHTPHEYTVKNANDRRHAKHIAMQLHAKKIGTLKQGEQYSSSNTQVKELQKEEVDLTEDLQSTIAKHLDKHISDFKSGHTGMDQFGSKVMNAHKKVAAEHGIEHAAAAKAVNAYVDKHLSEQASAADDGKTAPEEDETDTAQNVPTQVGHTMQHPADDQLRRRKVMYKLGEWVEMQEGVFGDPVAPNKKSELQTLEDLQSADYKTTASGHKYRARHINFAASKGNAAPVEGDDEEQTQKRSHKSHGPLLKPVKEEVEDEYDGISTESDLDDMVKQIEDEEDILDAYDDDELVIVDDETGEVVSDVKEEVEQIDEVLSRAERMRAKVRFARTSSKRERRMKVVLKTRSSSATINKRARRLAINLIKQRIMKKPASQLTVGEKERVERMIAKRKNLINRLSMKLAPRVRKIENERLSHSKVTK